MKYLAFITLLVVTGCSGSLPTLKQYLLRADMPARFTAEQPNTNIELGAVTVASYIDGPGIVLETSDGKVRAARDHQWAEPLRESLRTFLAWEISANAGQMVHPQRRGENSWQQRINIRIDELHGTASGEARLVAYWTVINNEQAIIAERGFTDTEPLSTDGYEALVEAEKVLLRRLSAAIAATLSK